MIFKFRIYDKHETITFDEEGVVVKPFDDWVTFTFVIDVNEIINILDNNKKFIISYKPKLYKLKKYRSVRGCESRIHGNSIKSA